jgi:hypothetical protein
VLWNGERGISLGIYVSSLSRPERRSFVIATGFRAMYVPPLHEPLGRPLYIRDDTLLARSFNLDALRLEGEAARIADGIATRTTLREASFFASDTGVIAYSSGTKSVRSTLEWIDRNRDGHELFFYDGRNIAASQISVVSAHQVGADPATVSVRDARGYQLAVRQLARRPAIPRAGASSPARGCEDHRPHELADEVESAIVGTDASGGSSPSVCVAPPFDATQRLRALAKESPFSSDAGRQIAAHIPRPCTRQSHPAPRSPPEVSRELQGLHPAQSATA